MSLRVYIETVIIPDLSERIYNDCILCRVNTPFTPDFKAHIIHEAIDESDFDVSASCIVLPLVVTKKLLEKFVVCEW